MSRNWVDLPYIFKYKYVTKLVDLPYIFTCKYVTKLERFSLNIHV
jgi:hypothetical protein